MHYWPAMLLVQKSHERVICYSHPAILSSSNCPDCDNSKAWQNSTLSNSRDAYEAWWVPYIHSIQHIRYQIIAHQFISCSLGDLQLSAHTCDSLRTFASSVWWNGVVKWNWNLSIDSGSYGTTLWPLIYFYLIILAPGWIWEYLSLAKKTLTEMLQDWKFR